MYFKFWISPIFNLIFWLFQNYFVMGLSLKLSLGCTLKFLYLKGPYLVKSRPKTVVSKKLQRHKTRVFRTAYSHKPATWFSLVISQGCSATNFWVNSLRLGVGFILILNNKYQSALVLRHLTFCLRYSGTFHLQKNQLNMG